jgi:hypothetical protein
MESILKEALFLFSLFLRGYGPRKTRDKGGDKMQAVPFRSEISIVCLLGESH